MANAKSGKVWIIDASGALDETLEIESIKLMGGSDAATFSIKKGGSGGVVQHEMEAASTVNVHETDLGIRIGKASSPYVTITGTLAKAYIYTK